MPQQRPDGPDGGLRGDRARSAGSHFLVEVDQPALRGGGHGRATLLPPELDPRRPRARQAGAGLTRVRRLLLLAGWAALWCVLVSSHSGYSWFYFDHGSVLLFGGHPRGLPAAGGLHLYRNYPQYQIGPLTFLVAALVQPFGVLAAQVLMVAVGVGVVVAAERLLVSKGTQQSAVRLLAAQLLFIPLWAELAVH